MSSQYHGELSCFRTMALWSQINWQYLNKLFRETCVDVVKRYNQSFWSAYVWPNWAIYCTLGNFSLPGQQLYCPIFVKVLKSIIFLLKSFLGDFYRHLAIFSGHTAQRAHFIHCTYVGRYSVLWVTFCLLLSKIPIWPWKPNESAAVKFLLLATFFLLLAIWFLLIVICFLVLAIYFYF